LIRFIAKAYNNDADTVERNTRLKEEYIVMSVSENIQATINNRVEAKRDEIIAFLQQLVRIPSVTHPPGGDEGPVQAYVADKYKQMGLIVDVFEPTEVAGVQEHEGWWPGLDYTNRPNVVGIWKGSGTGKTLILNGHADVVDEGPRELWKHEPFGGEIEDGKLYGRGSVDMKGGIAAMTMAVEILQECGITCLGDVILESVVNEELGGYNGTLACIVKGYQGDAAIVTEPSDLKIEPGTKGGQAYKITVPGVGAHQSFWWEGVSALDKAIRIKQAIERFEEIRYRQTRNNELYADPVLFPTPAISDCIYSFVSGDPAIMGVPYVTKMELWIDVLPGEDLDEVTKSFEEHIMKAASLDWFMKDNPPKIERVDMRPIYPTKIPLDHQIVSVLKDSFSAVMNDTPKVCGFEAACDAMMFNKYSDTPAVVFGAGQLGSAHRPDEFMDIDQLIASVKILALTIVNFCGIDDKETA
jgi:acetylornithine deacetylase